MSKGALEAPLVIVFSVFLLAIIIVAFTYLIIYTEQKGVEDTIKSDYESNKADIILLNILRSTILVGDKDMTIAEALRHHFSDDEKRWLLSDAITKKIDSFCNPELIERYCVWQMKISDRTNEIKIHWMGRAPPTTSFSEAIIPGDKTIIITFNMLGR